MTSNYRYLQILESFFLMGFSLIILSVLFILITSICQSMANKIRKEKSYTIRAKNKFVICIIYSICSILWSLVVTISINKITKIGISGTIISVIIAISISIFIGNVIYAILDLGIISTKYPIFSIIISLFLHVSIIVVAYIILVFSAYLMLLLLFLFGYIAAQLHDY